MVEGGLVPILATVISRGVSMNPQCLQAGNSGSSSEGWSLRFWLGNSSCSLEPGRHRMGLVLAGTITRWHFSTMCKWMRPFWGTDCRSSPKSLSSAQANSLCSADIERARKFVRCYHSTHSLLCKVLRGSPGERGVSSSLRPRPSASICSV